MSNSSDQADSHSTGSEPQVRVLKMRELEQETGVGRETIRFYIREGLLPEPERPKRNVARYAQVHVERLKLIKKLQQERFLPLNVIKTIMKAEDSKPAEGIGAFIGLENALYPLLGDPKNLEPRRLVDVADDAGFPVEEVEELISFGLVQVDVQDGEAWLNSRNARIVSLWKGIRDAGFTEEVGYTADVWRVYAEFLDWLVREEVATFYGKLSRRLGQAQAAELAAAGVRTMNEILPLMRTDRIMRAIAEISERGELPQGVDDETTDD